MTLEEFQEITHELAEIPVVSAQKEKITNVPFIRELIDSFPGNYLILNQNRQIIVCNQAFADYTGREDANELSGLRIGQAIGCHHSEELETGCGSTPECTTCGAFNAVVDSIRNRPAVEECRLLTRGDEALDLRVATTPITIEREKFILVSMTDISHEKRREALERIFFHDILNTAGNMRGMSEILKDASGEEADELKEIIHDLSKKLIEEIQAQKELSAAERGELSVNYDRVSSLGLIHNVIQSFRGSEAGRSRKIILDPFSEDIFFISDPVQLRRVIANMIKNAIEASFGTETITAGCQSNNGNIQFWVHNPNYMEQSVQYQIFHRSFTTKGTGRGLGTYSMKLLTEKYLKGKIEFTSTEEEGTKFIISIPTA